MSQTTVPQRLGTYQQPKQFWLFSALQSLVLVVTAYLVAVFTYLVIVHLSGLPHGPLWDESFRSPLAYLLVVIAATVLMVPYFQKEWDKGMRIFSIMSALFLLAFASLSTTHIADPNIPLSLVSRFVIDPVRHLLNF